MPASVKEALLCGNQTASSFFYVPVLPLALTQKFCFASALTPQLMLGNWSAGCVSPTTIVPWKQRCPSHAHAGRVMMHSPDNAIDQSVCTVLLQPLYL